MGAVIAALDADEIGAQKAFNVTGGVRLDFAEIADTVRRVLPEAQIALGAGADPEDQSHGRFDIAAAARVLGWRAAGRCSRRACAATPDWLAEHPV